MVKHVEYIKTPFENKNFSIAYLVGCPDNRSERYRVNNIVNALWKRGVVADRYFMDNVQDLAENVGKYNLIILFRVFCNPTYIRDLFEKAYEAGCVVVYDVDDLKTETPDLEMHNRIFKTIMKSCCAITCTTEYLASKFRKLRKGLPVYVIPNTINDCQYFLSKKTASKDLSKVKIVYQSGTPTHDGDFKVAEEALLYVLKKYSNVELYIVGPLKLSDGFNNLKVFYVPYMDYIDLQSFVSYMDINIAPLQLIPYKKGKSELKIFEAALLRLPSVVSPVDSYKNVIINEKNGFLAGNKEQWVQYLSLLIENEKYRVEIGNNAYNDFVSKFYMGRNIDRIISIYKKIIEGKYNKNTLLMYIEQFVSQNLQNISHDERKFLFHNIKKYFFDVCLTSKHIMINFLGIKIKFKYRMLNIPKS